jgi:uncharacterized protein (TIGR02452 family)
MMMKTSAPIRFSVSCKDSDQTAEAVRQSLDMTRSKAQQLGFSALEIIKEGRYKSPNWENVIILDKIKLSQAAKVSIPPEATLPIAIRNQPPIPKAAPRHSPDVRIEVCNETTLQAAFRLFQQAEKPLALNFANGIQPGGGFLHGSRAQEENLCRSSGLYATLQDDKMYEVHRQRSEADSTDWIIYSPDVPVFRSDEGRELEQPWPLSFFTCAAPVAYAIGLDRARKLLKQRIQRVLAAAEAYGFRALVLGAWGCGAFGNDPYTTAEDFRSSITGKFCGSFDHIVFAVTDWSSDRRFLTPFREVFEPLDNLTCRPAKRQA